MLARKQKKPNRLDEAIDAVFDDMAGFCSDADEYDSMSAQLERLYRIKETNSPKRVSPDTWATVGANILGIAIIVGHERVNVITSKALSFVLKMR